MKTHVSSFWSQRRLARSSSVIARGFVLGLGLGALAPLSAQIAWDGDHSNANWSSQQNWVGGNVPTSGQTAEFGSSFTGSNNPNISANTTINALSFTSGLSKNMTLSRSAGTFTLGSGGMTNASARNITISAPISLGAAQTWSTASATAGTLTIAGQVTTNSFALTINAGASGPIQFTTTLSGAGTLTKTGTGTLTIGGTATTAHTGNFDINAGTVAITRSGGANRAIGDASVVTVASGATLNFNNGLSETIGALSGAGTVDNINATAMTLTLSGNNSTTFSGTLQDTGGNLTLAKGGTGTLTLSGSNTYAGGTILQNGTLHLGSANAIGSSGTLTFAGGTLRHSSSNTTDYSSRFSTAASQAYRIDTNSQTVTYATSLSSSGGTLNKIGNGTLILTANNTYTGTTTISGGTLQIGAGGTTGSLGTGAVTNNGILSFNRSDGITVSNTINGTGALVKTGSNTLTLSANNTYTGTTTISGGTLATTTLSNGSNNSSIGASGNAASNLVLNSGNLLYVGSANASTDRQFTLGTGTSGIGNNGTGTLTFSNGGGLSYLGSGNRTLNLYGTNTADNTMAVLLQDGSGGATGITKTDAGTWVLSNGANSYTGATRIDGGTLKIGSIQNGSNTSVIGNSSSAATNLVITGGATLQYTGGSASTDRLFSIGSGGGTITNTGGGTLTFSNAGSMGFDGFSGTRTLTLSGSGNMSIANVIGDNGGATSVVKTGTGTVSLSGANSYTGQTSIQNGTLSVNSIKNVGGGNSALGAPTTAGAGTINLGSGTTTGTLQYTGAAQSTDRVINLAGTTGGGTIDGSGSGGLTLTSNITATGVGAKSLTLTGTNANNVMSGVISNGSGTTTLVKEGTGTWTLSGTSSNTHTGGTTVNNGTLALAKTGGATAVGNLTIGNGSGTATVRLDGNNQIASTSTVTFNNGGGTPTLNLNGYSQTLAGISTTNTTAAIQLGSPGSATSLTVGDASNYTYAGTISGGSNASFVKTGTGTLTLSGTGSTMTGGATVNQGTLVIAGTSPLGTSGGTTVTSGATLHLSGVSNLNTSNGTLTLSGTGVGGAGALVGSGGNNRWNGDITLSGNTLISTSGTGYLALGTTSTSYDRANDPSGTPTDTHTLNIGSNTLTLSGTSSNSPNRAIYVNSRITGGPSGSLVIDMTNASDVVRLTANKNTFTGTTYINNGTLSLATLYNTYPGDTTKPNHFGINGPLVIGDGIGAANTARLDSFFNGTLYDELINYTTAVTIKQDGQWNLLNPQSIASLTMNGGAIELGTTGGVYLNGTLTVEANAGKTATITGTGTSTLSLNIHRGPGWSGTNDERTINVVGDTDNISDLTINTIINNGSILKTGAGTMTILNDNSGGYEGTTKINNGIINIQHGNALGQANGLDDTATIVNNGGSLQLQGGITVTNEKLTLDNLGFANPNTSVRNGALQNVSGNNTWAGNIVIAGGNGSISGFNDALGTRIQSDADLLTISGQVNSVVNGSIDVRGAGNTHISGAISLGNGGINKDGTGTLYLSGNNTYAGTTTVSGGVLNVRSNNALGQTSQGTTVKSGAALQIDNTLAGGSLNVAAEPTAINGTGISGTGALRNVVGNNTYQGQVTVQSSALITANSGTTLTLSGGTYSTAGASQTLTVGHSTHNGNINISGNMNHGGSVTTAVNFTKEGSGTVTFSGTTGTVGDTRINAGTLAVSSTSTLYTSELGSSAGTALNIATGGTVHATYTAGGGLNSSNVTVFAGTIGGGGKFIKDGDATLQFAGTSFDAGATSELVITGGTLSLTGSQVTFGTIRITGNTTIDFNNSANTFLSSANLIIENGAIVTVTNWVHVANNAAASTIWYLRSGPATGGLLDGSVTLGGSDILGGPGLNNIVFQGYPGMTTTWVSSGTSNGWFHHEIRPTPEPATYGAILLGSALALLGYRRHRQSKQAAAKAQA